MRSRRREEAPSPGAPGPRRSLLQRAAAAARALGGGAQPMGRGRRAVVLALQVFLLCLSLWSVWRWPSLTLVAAAVWLWMVWPLVVRRREGRHSPAPAPVHSLRVRYYGGHPALTRPGPGRLRVWPEDGAAELQVGRGAVAFPLSAVQAVTLVDGRVTVHTGYHGPLAWAAGRIIATGAGKFCGLLHHQSGDLAVIDRSRVLCDILRQGRPCRVVLAGPHGGGEDVYLETLVLLRPLAAWREPGAAGGSMGAASSPPHTG